MGVERSAGDRELKEAFAGYGFVMPAKAGIQKGAGKTGFPLSRA